MGGMDQDALRVRLRDFDAEVSETRAAERRVTVDAAQSISLLIRLRDDSETSMHRLVDLTAIDRGEQHMRFEIVYRLHSPSLNQRLRVHVPIGAADPVVDSAVGVWPAADWLEREVFDLFGIRFRGHPDLRRILLEAEFEGAPLRKDYPRQPDLTLPKEAER
jgi:NADH-quinone oxidoreductase subunit C